MTEHMNDASSEREAYSAPNYERFTFETSGLVQASDPGFLGEVKNDVSTAVAAGSVNSDW